MLRERTRRARSFIFALACRESFRTTSECFFSARPRGTFVRSIRSVFLSEIINLGYIFSVAPIKNEYDDVYRGYGGRTEPSRLNKSGAKTKLLRVRRPVFVLPQSPLFGPAALSGRLRGILLASLRECARRLRRIIYRKRSRSIIDRSLTLRDVRRRATITGPPLFRRLTTRVLMAVLRRHGRSRTSRRKKNVVMDIVQWQLALHLECKGRFVLRKVFGRIIVSSHTYTRVRTHTHAHIEWVVNLAHWRIDTMINANARSTRISRIGNLTSARLMLFVRPSSGRSLPRRLA